MATRSTITVRINDKERLSIYCHWDGYPEHHLPILTEHYNTLEKAKELVSHGDLSQLEKKVNPETEFHSFNNPEKDVCIYYGRDRGEEGTEPVLLTNIESILEEEFNYYFDGNTWKYNGGYSIW